MTTLQGYSDGSYSYDDLTTITRTSSTKRVINKGTLLHAMFLDSRFRAFTDLVCSNPDLSAKMNSPNARFTVFAPQTVEIQRPDCEYDVRKYIENHTLVNEIPLILLNSSQTLYIKGSLSGNSIRVDNIPEGIILNERSKILAVKQVGMNMLYLIDKSLSCV
jgi:hypothetical protein